ncbi:hypothetical protein RJ640_029232 [Escallonia rubra]|uniref:O-acyltransferase WSD1 C-terminal domain-containing protein n=1 Tax=Escallonia rubra TaxID=112253 RepID=A0AA88U662_9ASTE|nr:hypothetical protein RJ640_029232 [Escallonia rubra]
MEAASYESGKAHSTALVLLNTRSKDGYKSVSEMVKPHAEMPWGNRFAFLHVPLPKLTVAAESSDPLEFVRHASNIIKKKRNSSGVHLTGAFLETIRKYKGSESLCITMMSYMKKVRVVVGATKGHIDSKGFKSCVEQAFQMIFKAAVSPSSC